MDKQTRMQPVADSPLGGWVLRATMEPDPTERKGLPLDPGSRRVQPTPSLFTSFLSGVQMAVVLKGKVGFLDGSASSLPATSWVGDCE